MKIIQEKYDLKLAVLVECKFKFFGFQKTVEITRKYLSSHKNQQYYANCSGLVVN